MNYNDNGKKGRKPNSVFYMFIFVLSIGSASVFGAATPLERQRALYLAAESALEKDDLTDFERLAVQFEHYPLYPHLLYRKYQSHPEEIPQVTRFLRDYARTRYAWPVRKRMLVYLAKEKRWQEYLEHYQSTKDVMLQCHYYWALRQTGKIKQAWQGARRLWLAGHSQPAACDALFYAWRQAGGLTQDLIWQRFQLALKSNQIRLALYLQKMLPKASRPLAALWLEGHRRPEIIACDPDRYIAISQGRLFAHSIHRLASKDLSAALDLWQQWAPKLELDAEAKAKIDRFLALKLAWKHDPRAWYWLNKIPRIYQNRATRSWRVRAALRQQDWHGVKQAIGQLKPKEKQRGIWKYWLARAEEATYGKDSAREIYLQLAGETNFNGFMAADHIQQEYSIIHRPIQPSDRMMAQLTSSRSIKAIREFLALDRYWEARREWWYLLSHLGSDGLLAAARWAKHQGLYQMAIVAVANAKHWNDLEVRFPLHYLAPVTKYAQAQDLAPAFVYGIIRRESAFDDRASSSVGARGLMQLMPATAGNVAQRLNYRLAHLSSLEDPDTNIRLGTAYFRSLLEKLSGHFVLATAAYNAGPHRVERWLPKNQNLPADIWIETIPFRETRRYVRAVLAYATIYQKRLNHSGERVSAYLKPVPVGQVPEEKENKMAECVSSSIKLVQK